MLSIMFMTVSIKSLCGRVIVAYLTNISILPKLWDLNLTLVIKKIEVYVRSSKTFSILYLILKRKRT